MKVRAVEKNSSGSVEWRLGQGYTTYIDAQKAIEQDIYCALNEFKFDCFWDLNSGIDWRSRLGLKNQKQLLDNDVIEVIKSREGVLDVQDFVSYVNDRVYSCQCTVYTIYSENFNLTYSKEL